MSQAVEVNFDGIVGPTHNYSGLSYGNVASLKNQKAVANPREAALQGLDKMKYLADLGLVQGVIPPQERPYLPILRKLGYKGTDKEIWQQVAKDSTELLCACSSAASMWTANAATVSPSADSEDGKVHFTPANLNAKFHRSIEPKTTSSILKAIFNDPHYFIHHAPLPSGASFSDEGAANHTRFCQAYGGNGVQLFAWGRSAFQSHYNTPKLYPARQTLESVQSLVRLHRLRPESVVFAQQNPEAIDAGVFHNDVISVGNKNVFLCHEEAFVEQGKVIEQIARKLYKTSHADLSVLHVPSKQISLKDAVATYLFNSQIICLSNNCMALIAPIECQRHPMVNVFLEELIQDKTNPIKEVHYLNLHESMRNGGGPACLRLRVVLTPKERLAMHQDALLTETLYSRLKEWIMKHYRDRLLPKDLADPLLIKETHVALEELTRILRLGNIYEFQK